MKLGRVLWCSGRVLDGWRGCSGVITLLVTVAPGSVPAAPGGAGQVSTGGEGLHGTPHPNAAREPPESGDCH